MAKRRRFSGKKKVEILRRHLLEGEPVSDVCDEYDLSPSQFYRWQKKFFEKGDAAFRRKTGSQERKLKKKVSALQEKIAKKDEVIAEIMESHVRLKKKKGSKKKNSLAEDTSN
ncbi:MAG: transposase [Candidatus Brocadiia bacterium]